MPRCPLKYRDASVGRVTVNFRFTFASELALRAVGKHREFNLPVPTGAHVALKMEEDFTDRSHGKGRVNTFHFPRLYIPGRIV